MIRSGYSFHAAYGHIDKVADCVKEIGWSVAPLADRNSTFGFNKWTKLCKKFGLRPVYGIEIACVAELGQKKPIIDYWTFLAKDNLRPLHDLFYLATSNPGKDPSLLYAQALAAPGLFKIAGERLLVDKLPKELPDDFYLSLSPATPKGLVKRATDLGLPLSAKSDNYFPRAEDEEAYRVALGWRSGTQTYPRHILSDEEWSEATQWAANPEQQIKALVNRNLVLDACHATMKQGQLLRFPRTRSLWDLCIEGAERRGIDLNGTEYEDRLVHELRVIKEKDFEDYFFILHDMMAYARDVMCIGPGRGSSGGSLVCFLLGITAIDPLKFGLIFERFIDINRADLPDCDIDFSDERRHLVFEYAEKKYGKDRVARLGAVGFFRSKNTLVQVGKELKIPRWDTEGLYPSLIKYAAGDDRFGHEIEDTFAQTQQGQALLKKYPELAIATQIEASPSQAGKHAAGLILTESPVMDFVAVDARNRTTHCDKTDAEDLNLLKIDALGLIQLSVFERCLTLMGREPRSAFLEALPLNDVKAFEVLNTGKFAGIFQWGQAVQQLTRQIKVENIDDMIALNALARPGPLDSGGAQSWVARRTGKEKVQAYHPKILELTQNERGVLIFQENIMHIAREIGQMSWADVSALRRAVSKSKGGEAIDMFWPQFRQGALSHGIDEWIAEQIWRSIKTFGYYGFNKAHAVAYALVAYWCCWLKAHHPLEFAAATLDATKDPEAQMKLLRELALEGVEYTPVDAEHSEARWTVVNDRLVGPLTQIKGIGPAKVQEILESRKFKKPLRASIAKQLVNVKTEIDTLFPIKDRIKELHPDLEASGIVTKPTAIDKVQPGILGEVVVFGVVTRMNEKDENNAEALAKRNGRLVHPPTSLNLFLQDDSGEVLCKIGRQRFAALAPRIMEQVKAKKTLIAAKGIVPLGFRMVDVSAVKVLGEL